MSVAKDSLRAPSLNRTAAPAGSAASGGGNSANGYVVPYLPSNGWAAVSLPAGVVRIVRTMRRVRAVGVVLRVHSGRRPDLLHHERGSIDRRSILRRDGSLRRDRRAGRESRNQKSTSQTLRYSRNDTTARKQIRHTLAHAGKLHGSSIPVLPLTLLPTIHVVPIALF